MPAYTYTRPSDGKKIRVRSDSPPSKEELDALFLQADELPPVEITPAQPSPEAIAAPEGAPDVVEPIYPPGEPVIGDMGPTTLAGFEAARERPGRVVRFEEGEQITETAPVIPTPGPMRYRPAEPEAPSLVMPTAEEATAVVAGAAGLPVGVAEGAGRLAKKQVSPWLRAPVSTLAGLIGADISDYIGENERRLEDELDRDWSDAIAEDAGAIANLGEVLANAVNKAMEKAKGEGADPAAAVFDTAKDAGITLAGDMEKDFLTFLRHPIDYARAYPLTTAAMVLPAAMKGAPLAAKFASESPRVSKIINSAKGKFEKIYLDARKRGVARRHGLTPEQLAEAESLAEAAPRRPGSKPPAPPADAPPVTPPSRGLVSPMRKEVNRLREEMGVDPIVPPEAKPQRVAFEGLEGGMTEGARKEWAAIKDKWASGADDIGMSERETAVIHTVMKDAEVSGSAAARMADDIASGRTPIDPASDAGKEALLRANMARAEAEDTMLKAMAIDKLGSRSNARASAMRQNFLNDSFNLIHMRAVATGQKGSPLTGLQDDAIKAISARAEGASARLSDMRERLEALKKALGAEADSKRAAALELKMDKLGDDMFAPAKELGDAMEKWKRLKHVLARGTVWGAVQDMGDLIAHAPKMLRAIWDMSGSTVQAGLSGLGHPVLWTKALKAYSPVGGAWGPKQAWRTARKMADDPAWDLAKKYRLPLYDLDATTSVELGLTATDDMFAQGAMSAIVNMSPALAAWVSPSTRVHAAFLNSYRMSLFKLMMGLDLPATGQMTGYQKLANPLRRNVFSAVKEIREELKTAPKARRPMLKDALKQATLDQDASLKWGAEMAGTVSGHGTWLAGEGGVGGAFFWSKRMFAAAFEHPVSVAGGAAFRAGKAGASTGRAAMIQAATTADAMRSAVGMYAAMYAAETILGADVGMNPLSGNFGRIRVGDKVVDIGGFQMVLIRTIASVISGERGVVDAIGRFMRKKASPTISAMSDLITGSDYMGTPVDVASTLANLFVPLSAEAFLRGWESGTVQDATLFTTFKAVGGKAWEEGGWPRPLGEVAPYSFLPQVDPLDYSPWREWADQ